MKLTTRVAVLHGPLEMAPMVNVCLLLLFFFLLSSTFVLQPGVEVRMHERLPGGGATMAQRVVAITRSSTIYFEDQQMDLGQLQDRLSSLRQEQGIRVLVIKADVDAPHGVVMSVLEAAGGIGLDVVLASRAFGQP